MQPTQSQRGEAASPDPVCRNPNIYYTIQYLVCSS